MIFYGIIDAIELYVRSSSGILITQALKYIALWLLIDIPAAFIGSYQGHNRELSVYAIASEEKKEIPAQPWYMKWYVSVPVLGIYPFIGNIALMKYLMDSVWRSNLIYALFGWLLTNFILLILGLAVASII